MSESHCCTPENIVNQLYFKNHSSEACNYTSVKKTSKQLSSKACMTWSLPASPVSFCKSLPTLSPQFEAQMFHQSQVTFREAFLDLARPGHVPTEHLSEHSVLHSTPELYQFTRPPPRQAL